MADFSFRVELFDSSPSPAACELNESLRVLSSASNLAFYSESIKYFTFALIKSRVLRSSTCG